MKLLITITVLLFSFNSFTQGLSLQEAKSIAVQNNLRMKSAGIDSKIVEQNIKEIQSMALPQISGEFGYNYFVDIPTQLAPADAFGFPDWMVQTLAISAQQNGVSIPEPTAGDEFSELQFGTKHNMKAGLNVNQALFDGSLVVALKSRKAVEQLQVDINAITETEVKETVHQAYFMIAVAEENLKILSKSQANTDKMANEAKVMNETGFIELLDYQQIQIIQNNLKNSISQAKNGIKSAKALLNFHLGRDLNTEFQISDSLPTLIQNIDEYSIKNYEEGKSPELQLLGTQLKTAELTVMREKANFLPKLYAFGTHSQNFQRDNLDIFEKWYPTTIVGLNLNVPIYSGGRGSIRVKRAKFEMTKLELQKQMAESGKQLEFINAKNDFSSAYDSFINSKNTLELSESIKNKTDIKFKEGMSSSMDVNQVNSQYLQNQGMYINAVLQMLTAKNKIDKILNNY
jgi:outer membrane protein TolC